MIISVLIATAHALSLPPLASSSSSSQINQNLSSASLSALNLPVLPINQTLLQSSSLDHANSTNNTALTNPIPWPKPPFALEIPDLEPSTKLVFLKVGRVGLGRETDSLLAVIDEQLAYFKARAGLPESFTKYNADVTLEMQVVRPKQGLWINKAEVVGALGVLEAVNGEYGARECSCFVQSEEDVMASFVVRFHDME